jgi:hypothetical protein
MDLVVFEEDKPRVLQALGNGEFDYIVSVRKMVVLTTASQC